MSAETSAGIGSGGLLPIMAASSSLVTVPAPPALPLHAGQLVRTVVERGSGAVVEAGRVAALRGAMSRVRREECSCETRGPLDDLFGSRDQAHGVEARQTTDRISTAEAAGSAGRMSLPYLLSGRPVGR